MQYCYRCLDETLEPYDLPLHETDWGNMATLAIRHYVRTPRDVKRFTNAIPLALDVLDGEVALVDVLGLEALRIFEPDVHLSLPRISAILTGTRLNLGGEGEAKQREKEEVEEVLKRASEYTATQHLLSRLFPAAASAIGVGGRSVREERTERREGRVANRGPFDAYVHASLDSNAISAAEVRGIVSLLGSPAELAAKVSLYSDTRLVNLIGRLSDFAEDFEADYAVGAGLVFLSIEPQLAPDQSPFSTGSAPASWQLHWLLGHLLLAVPEEARSTKAVELVDGTATLSQRLRALNWFGTFPDAENRDPDSEMISEDESQRLLEDLRTRVANAAPDDLASEYMLRQLLAGQLHPDEEAGRRIVAEKIADDRLLIALIQGSLSTVVRTSITDAVGTSTPKLDWEGLTWLIGESRLRDRLLDLPEATVAALTGPTQGAVKMAIEIAQGERAPSSE